VSALGACEVSQITGRAELGHVSRDLGVSRGAMTETWRDSANPGRGGGMRQATIRCAGRGPRYGAGVLPHGAAVRRAGGRAGLTPISPCPIRGHAENPRSDEEESSDSGTDTAGGGSLAARNGLPQPTQGPYGRDMEHPLGVVEVRSGAVQRAAPHSRDTSHRRASSWCRLRDPEPCAPISSGDALSSPRPRLGPDVSPHS
jgi:hypothetical protein